MQARPGIGRGASARRRAARRRTSLWTKAGMAWLRELTFPTFSHTLRRDLLLEEIEALFGLRAQGTLVTFSPEQPGQRRARGA